MQATRLLLLANSLRATASSSCPCSSVHSESFASSSSPARTLSVNPRVVQTLRCRHELTRLGFTHSQATVVAARLPTGATEMADSIERLSGATSVLRQFGLSQPHAVLSRLRDPNSPLLEADELAARLEFYCQFLTRKNCYKMLESKPNLLARDNAELKAIADYLVYQCGYTTDVLALMTPVWLLSYQDVVTRREIFAKAGRLTRQPKKEFNRRSISGCDCFSMALPVFLQRSGISVAEYEMYSEITAARIRAQSDSFFVSSGQEDEAGTDDAEELSDSDDEEDETELV